MGGLGKGDFLRSVSECLLKSAHFPGVGLCGVLHGGAAYGDRRVALNRLPRTGRIIRLERTLC